MKIGCHSCAIHQLKEWKGWIGKLKSIHDSCADREVLTPLTAFLAVFSSKSCFSANFFAKSLWLIVCSLPAAITTRARCGARGTLQLLAVRLPIMDEEHNLRAMANMNWCLRPNASRRKFQQMCS